MSLHFRPCLRCRIFNVSSRPILQHRSLSGTPTEQPTTPGSIAPLVPDVDPPISSTTPGSVSELRPVGSRRRREALKSSANIPFEQLPYQCFQEARKVLQTDRNEKIQQIQVMRGRIARLLEQEPSISGGERAKQHRLTSMRAELENLKILADINDPLVKKRFEDGKGDMNKPIYRHLADKKWRSYRRRLVMQRVTQMHVIPDILPAVDPKIDVNLAFGRRSVQPGQIVESRISEVPPKFTIQPFDKGARLLTIAVVDPDVPDLAKDGFRSRCHLLVSNVSVSPTSTLVPVNSLSSDEQVILPWLPPHAQKGSPYHRLAIFVMQQSDSKPLDLASTQKRFQRDGFNLRSFVAASGVVPIGVQMFRTQWDEGTAGVMERAGIPGSNIELKRKRIQPLPYKKKDGARYR